MTNRINRPIRRSTPDLPRSPLLDVALVVRVPDPTPGFSLADVDETADALDRTVLAVLDSVE